MTIGKVYGSVMTTVWSGGLDWENDTIKCSLHSSTYSPNQDTHSFRSSLAGEISGTGYTAGGATVANCTLTYEASTNTLVADCDDVTWSSATLSGIRYAVFYKDTGNAATSPLIAYMDFETDQSVTGANLQIVIPATGLVRATVA